VAFNYWKSDNFSSKYFGTPTPSYPESNTLIQCYAICSKLTLKFDISASELVYYAKILRNPEYLKTIVYIEGNLMSLFDEIKNYKVIKSEINLRKEDWLLCKDINKNILKHFIPQTEKLAVTLSAIFYDLDISLTSNPIAEFSSLISDPSKYIPIDPVIAYVYVRNPEAFKLSYNFNPNFSTEFYSPTTLQKLCKFEGYTETTDPHYETLQINSVISTFYQGFRPKIQNTKTIVNYDLLNMCQNSEIIAYGTKDNLTAFTVSELITSFDNNLAFILPTNETLTPININKLFNISKIVGHHKIIEVIKTVRSYETNKGKIIAKLVREYNNTSDDQKEKIRGMLEALLHLGFFMRGWMNSGDFPVINCPVNDYDKVDTTIIDGIVKFETITNGKYGDLIRNFPLMKYVKNFIFSNSNTDGYTVIDRINIVKVGGENSSSCVRLSSNWLCATAYKMYQVLKLPIPFRIEDLRSIS